DFILKARNAQTTGWRYEPGQPGDTSVLGWQVMALKSAKMSGVELPADTLETTETWLKRVCDVRRFGEPADRGLYSYLPGQRPSYTMTAEGMFIMELIGVPVDDARMEAASRFVMTQLPSWRAKPNTYYWYYATLALFQKHDERWERWNHALL